MAKATIAIKATTPILMNLPASGGGGAGRERGSVGGGAAAREREAPRQWAGAATEAAELSLASYIRSLDSGAGAAGGGADPQGYVDVPSVPRQPRQPAETSPEATGRAAGSEPRAWR